MNTIIRILLIVVLVAPIFLQYLLDWHFTPSKTYTFSIYGIYLFVYICIQFTFAILNNASRLKNNTDTHERQFVYNIIVVGWREHGEYFRNCLESVKTSYLNSKNVNKVYVIIDGNESDDEYMKNIFNQVFPNDSMIKSTNITFDDSYTTNKIIVGSCLDTIKENNIVCINQKHSGKRGAMYTGFQISLLEAHIHQTPIKAVFCTDSDTVIQQDTVDEMFTTLCDKNDVGAIAGNLGIFNKYETLITFMSSLRYWYAFNLERAYQSYTGGVLCVSGPIGMYRLDSLRDVLEDWNNQVFLGKKCTYGDDRHLSNKILSLGHKIVFIPQASAQTETPNSLYRFYKQQTRWNKSAFREFFWTWPILDKHSFFMTIDLIYVLIYPFIVIGYLLYLLWSGTVFHLGLYMCILLGMGLVKSVYGYFVSGDPETLWYFLYSIVYTSIVFPARICALLNMNDTNWGTSMRSGTPNKNINIDALVPIVWNLSLLSGTFYNIYVNVLTTNIFDYLYIVIPCFIVVFNITALKLYIRHKQNLTESKHL